MTKRVYKSTIEDIGIRGRPPVKWEDRVHEFMRERGVTGMRGRRSRSRCTETTLSVPVRST